MIIGCKSATSECLCRDCSCGRDSEECREYREEYGLNEYIVE